MTKCRWCARESLVVEGPEVQVGTDRNGRPIRAVLPTPCRSCGCMPGAALGGVRPDGSGVGIYFNPDQSVWVENWGARGEGATRITISRELLERLGVLTHFAVAPLGNASAVPRPLAATSPATECDPGGAAVDGA